MKTAVLLVTSMLAGYAAVDIGTWVGVRIGGWRWGRVMGAVFLVALVAAQVLA